MKKLAVVIVLGGLLLSGCCYKILCMGTTIYEVRFYGFDFHDLDTIQFEAYDQNGIDTLSRYQWWNTQKQMDGYVKIDFEYNNFNHFDETKSYRFTIPKTGQIYEVSDLHYKDDHCKSGMCRQDFRSLDFYYVNGQVQFLQDHALMLNH